VAEALLPIANIGIAGSHTENYINFWIFGFTDPHGGTHTATEWQLNTGDIVTAPPNQFLPTGHHTIRARVRNSTGIWSNWIVRTFFVSTFHSTIAVANPVSGTAVTSIPIPLRVSLSNASFISRIEYFVNGVLVGQASTAPWEVQWSGSNGSYTLQARIIRPSGAIVNSAIIPFTVSLAPFVAAADGYVFDRDGWATGWQDSCTGEWVGVGWHEPPPHFSGVGLNVQAGRGAPYTRTAFLQFNLTAIPANAQIISARLVTSNASLNIAPVTSVAIHRVTSFWNDGNPGWMIPSTTPFSGVSVQNLTPLVQGWVNGTIPNLGMALTSGTAWDFASRESGRGAQLVIDYRLP